MLSRFVHQAARTGNRSIRTIIPSGSGAVSLRQSIISCSGSGSGADSFLPTVPTSSLSSTSIRHFSNKKKNRNSNKKKPKDGKGNKVEVYTSWGGESPEEVDPDEDEMNKLDIGHGNLDKFLQDYREKNYIDDNDDEVLNIYTSSSKDFKPLVSMEQVQAEQKASNRVILSPGYVDDDESDYDESDYDDYDPSDDYNEDIDRDDYHDVDGLSVKTRLTVITKQMKEDGWVPRKSGVRTMTREGTENTIKETRDIILDLAKNDKSLQAFLVNNIGALDHFADCVHYEFVWNSDSVAADTSEGDTDDDIKHEHE